jgi:hypothetical protein
MRSDVRRILEAYKAATPREVAEGAVWYPTAHALAGLLAGYGNEREGAGVIAALSPQIQWDRNVVLATDAYADYWHGQVHDARNKARRIMQGEDPDTVLPRGKKTWHFFHSINTPETTEHVTIDRHAVAIAEGIPVRCNPGKIGVVRYRTTVAAYLGAAHILSRPVSEVQAIVWVARRNSEYNHAEAVAWRNGEC